MTADTTKQFAQHRLEQLRRAAQWPLSERLEWLYRTLAVAQSLQNSKRVAAPPWSK